MKIHRLPLWEIYHGDQRLTDQARTVLAGIPAWCHHYELQAHFPGQPLRAFDVTVFRPPACAEAHAFIAPDAPEWTEALVAKTFDVSGQNTLSTYES